jgi:hypothetical protein
VSNFVTVSAERLRLSLSIVLGFLAVLTIGVSILGLGALRSFASEVNAVVAEADSIDNRIEITKQKIALYEQNVKAAELANQVVAENEGYQYQNEAYNDLLAIAKRAGLTITRYSFSDSAGVLSGQTDRSAQIVEQTVPTSTNGAKPTYITIELDNPVNYRKFLNFIYFIEQNLTKMQIASVSLSSAGGGPETVSTGSITVEVYIK